MVDTSVVDNLQQKAQPDGYLLFCPPFLLGPFRFTAHAVLGTTCLEFVWDTFCNSERVKLTLFHFTLQRHASDTNSKVDFARTLLAEFSGSQKRERCSKGFTASLFSSIPFLFGENSG